MKTSLILGVTVAAMIALFLLFYFVHPVLILTLGDIIKIVLVDVIVAFILALYLGHDKGKNYIIFWTIIGSAFLPITIVASLIKYNKGKQA